MTNAAFSVYERNEKSMKNEKKNTTAGIMTALLALTTAFSILGVVHSRNKESSTDMEQYYYAARQEYMQEIRDYLEEKGYADSGITMNYVTDGDGNVEYTVTIHHRKIDKLDEEEKTHLAEECKGLKTCADPYFFSVVFL